MAMRGMNTTPDGESLSKCEECNNVGYIYCKDTNTVGKECQCRIKRLNKERLERSGLADKVEKCTFDNFIATSSIQKEMKEKALNYIKNIDQCPWFYIGGQTGVGKTHICTAISNYLINNKAYSLKYVKANKIIADLKANVMDYENRLKIYEGLMYCKVLYIDDLFKTKNATDADIRILFDIIDDRDTSNLITIISSEKTLRELGEIDEAIAGRIRERTKEDYTINIARNMNLNYRLRK